MATNKLTIQKGNPYARVLQFNDTSVTPAVPYDLTGKTIFFTVKKWDDVLTDDTAAVIQKTITVHTHADAGTSSLELTAIQTDISKGDYKYDFRLYQAAPLVQLNSIKGVCEITDKVTERIT
jgi:hypothetical protein